MRFEVTISDMLLGSPYSLLAQFVLHDTVCRILGRKTVVC